MVENGSGKFQLPEASWNTLKKIIRAYYAKRNNEHLTVEEVAGAAGLHRPQVSANNNFLRAFGVLEQESNQLTADGSELAVGVTREDEYTIRESLRKLVQSCQPLRRLVETVEAREQLERESFDTQLQLSLNVDQDDRRLRWAATILDILQASGTIEVEDGVVRSVAESHHPPEVATVSAPAPQNVTPTIANDSVLRSAPGLRRIPIPVSPGSLWYVEVAESLEPQEIKKFLDMQRLIFDVKD